MNHNDMNWERRESGLLVPAHSDGAWDRALRGHRFRDPELRRLADVARGLGAVGSTQGWIETLAVQRAAGTLFNTYTAAKSVINADALYDAARNFFVIGKQLRLFVSGAISNIVTTPGLMNFQIKIGSVAAFDTGNVQLNATAHVTIPFWLDVILTVRAIGAATAANVIGLGLLVGKMFTLTAGQADDAQGHMPITVPAAIPAVGAGFDSTVVNLIDLWVGFTISNVGNGVQVHQYSLQALN